MEKEAKNRILIQTIILVVLVYFINVLLLPFLETMPITAEKALVGIPVSIIGGVFFYLFMYFMEKKKN